MRLPLACSPAGYLAQVQGSSAWAGLERLPSLRVPTLVVHGDGDRLVPPVNGQRIAQAVPGAELVVLPNANHLFLHRPARPHQRDTAGLACTPPRPAGGVSGRAAPGSCSGRRRTRGAAWRPQLSRQGRILRLPVLVLCGRQDAITLPGGHEQTWRSSRARVWWSSRTGVTDGRGAPGGGHGRAAQVVRGRRAEPIRGRGEGSGRRWVGTPHGAHPAGGLGRRGHRPAGQADSRAGPCTARPSGRSQRVPGDGQPPAGAAKLVEFGTVVYFDNSMTPAQRELAYLTASVTNECHY